MMKISLRIFIILIFIRRRNINFRNFCSDYIAGTPRNSSWRRPMIGNYMKMRTWGKLICTHRIIQMHSWASNFKIIENVFRSLYLSRSNLIDIKRLDLFFLLLILNPHLLFKFQWKIHREFENIVLAKTSPIINDVHIASCTCFLKSGCFFSWC